MDQVTHWWHGIKRHILSLDSFSSIFLPGCHEISNCAPPQAPAVELDGPQLNNGTNVPKPPYVGIWEESKDCALHVRGGPDTWLKDLIRESEAPKTDQGLSSWCHGFHSCRCSISERNLKSHWSPTVLTLPFCFIISLYLRKCAACVIPRKPITRGDGMDAASVLAMLVGEAKCS